MAFLLSPIAKGLKNGSVEIHTCLVKAKDVFPHVNQIPSSQKPHFEGTVDNFLASKGENVEKFRNQMFNKVKLCTCRKPVAFSLPNCNGCGLDLTNTPISFSPNIFSSFAYGIQKGAFPFTISMRAMDKESIVIDDLLALTATHFNVIPTNQYLSDWRYLCRKPKEGLQLIDSLFDKAWVVLRDQFLSNSEWRNKIISPETKLDINDFKNHLACGCNYPPSQYQLHLQFMLPPFLPQHWLLFLKGLHFTYERFFPVEYIRAVLQLNIPYDVKEDTKIEDIIYFYDQKGVSYQKIWQYSYEQYSASHKRFSNWNPQDFGGILIGDNFCTISDNKASINDEQFDLKAIQNSDKMILQNYGRPYNESGKPTGGYYSFPRDQPMDQQFS